MNLVKWQLSWVNVFPGLPPQTGVRRRRMFVFLRCPYFSPTIDVREVTNQRWLLPTNLNWILGEITSSCIADGISMIFHCGEFHFAESLYYGTRYSPCLSILLIKHRDQMCSVNSIQSQLIFPVCVWTLSNQTFSHLSTEYWQTWWRV